MQCSSKSKKASTSIKTSHFTRDWKGFKQLPPKLVIGMASSNTRIILIITIAGMFLFGFGFGYFIQGSALLVAEGEINKVRDDLDNLQLEQLMLLQAPEKSCPVITESARQSSQKLYDLVNQLRRENPDSPSFTEIKGEADFLSIKSWILSNAIEDRCGEGITSILFIYSDDCEKCPEQDSILQSLKADYSGQVLVYAADYESTERVVSTVKAAYGVTEAPSIIIKGSTRTFTSKEELVKLLS